MQRGVISSANGEEPIHRWWSVDLARRWLEQSRPEPAAAARKAGRLWIGAMLTVLLSPLVAWALDSWRGTGMGEPFLLGLVLAALLYARALDLRRDARQRQVE